jgi:hypothetical protein
MTLHSWGAIAPTVDNVDKLISYIKTARPALLRWRATQVLIIDEGTPLQLIRKRSAYSVFGDFSVNGGWTLVRENLCYCHSTQEEDRQAVWWYPGWTPCLCQCPWVIMTLCSLLSRATSSSYLPSPREVNNPSSHLSAMHGKHVLSIQSH